jgi:redox-sensitive bicupin YhaK (pirin superfamily)
MKTGFNKYASNLILEISPYIETSPSVDMEKNAVIKTEPLGFPWNTLDPFIFCVHHRDEYPKGNEHMGPDASLEGRNIGQDFTVKDGWRMYHGQKVPGFPYHPHRGFETITVVKEGLVDHTDSMGAAGRFGKGDVQWMTAGGGVQHSEMFPLVHQDKENPLELFQIWLNLPRSSKLVKPHFKMLWEDEIPVYSVKDENGHTVEVHVIAGNLYDLAGPRPTPDSWAANPDHHIQILTARMEAEAKWILPKAAPGLNRTIYFYKGDQLHVEGMDVGPNHSIRVHSDRDVSMKAGHEDCYFMVLQGKPIGEPVVQYGPFVMNTKEEIQEAYREYQRTQFGGWPWPDQEQTHDRSRGRFALHADGQEEIKD